MATTPLSQRLVLLPLRDPRPRRLIQLGIGLVLFALGLALGVDAGFGNAPWTVFHQGLAEQTPLTIGTATVLVGLLLLVCFPIFREPLGIGTIANVIIIGPVIDLFLWIIPNDMGTAARVIAVLAAPAVVGLASGLYIGAGLGPGPRDGIMTALERRGMKVWIARTIIEFTALSIGWLLGGVVGWGTIWIAGSLGWFVQRSLRYLRIDPAVSPGS